MKVQLDLPEFRLSQAHIPALNCQKKRSTTDAGTDLAFTSFLVQIFIFGGRFIWLIGACDNNPWLAPWIILLGSETEAQQNFNA